MFNRPQKIRSASICAYFGLCFAILNLFAGSSYFCARGPLRFTFRLALACTIWDLFACVVGLWVGQKMLNSRAAVPMLAGAITAAGIASIPFWIYRGYGHFHFEGTLADVSCYFAEGYGMAFPFVVAPILGLLTLLHGILWLRASKVLSAAVAGSSAIRQ